MRCRYKGVLERVEGDKGITRNVGLMAEVDTAADERVKGGALGGQASQRVRELSGER